MNRSSLGAFAMFPSEIITRICTEMQLEDIVHFQESHPYLDSIIDHIFFASLQKMRITWDDSGASSIVLSPRRNHSYLKDAFSISGDSPARMALVKKAIAVDSLTIAMPDHQRDFALLNSITDAGIALTKIVINLYRGKSEPQRQIIMRCHYKLCEFVKSQSATLDVLKVSTGKEDSVLFDRRPPKDAPPPVADPSLLSCSSSASGVCTFHVGGVCPTPVMGSVRVEYAHPHNTQMHQSLIYPLFAAINMGKNPPSSAFLSVDWVARPSLALQSALKVALPLRNRTKVRSLYIDFSAKVASLTLQEIRECLEEFSTSFEDFINLKEIICDFRKSQLHPAHLEPLYGIISAQIPRDHRIRLLTKDLSQDRDAEYEAIKREWMSLPRVF